MPTKKPAKTLDTSNVQFINYSLTDKEKAAFKKALADIDWGKFYEAFDAILDDGYTISCKWDEFNDCYSTFITCKKQDSPNFNCILTGRGRTAAAATFAALYRHLTLFDKNWPVETVNHRGTDDD